MGMCCSCQNLPRLERFLYYLEFQARPPSKQWAYMELSRVLNGLAQQPSPLSQLPAFTGKMALDFIRRSCPRAVQTQVCVPSACWMFFPNVPVLSLTLTRPHSLKTLPLCLHLKSRKKEQRVWVGSRGLGGR